SRSASAGSAPESRRTRRARSSGRRRRPRRRWGTGRGRTRARPLPPAVGCRGGSWGARWGGDIFPSLTLAEEIADRAHDGVAIANFARDQPVVVLEMLAQVLDELPRAVGALDLAVAEHVGRWKKLLPHELDAEQRVVDAPVVAVGKMEGVD